MVMSSGCGCCSFMENLFANGNVTAAFEAAVRVNADEVGFFGAQHLVEFINSRAIALRIDMAFEARIAENIAQRREVRGRPVVLRSGIHVFRRDRCKQGESLKMSPDPEGDPGRLLDLYS